jgi:molecular chaperone GrpE (heat shock protein)
MTTPSPSDPNPEPAYGPQLEALESAMRTAAKGALFPRAALAQNARVVVREEPAPEPAALPAEASETQAWRDEMADDLLELLRQVQTLSAQQTQLQASLDALTQEMRGAAGGSQREVAQLRSELLSQRRGMAVRSIFESLVGPWERLRVMSEALSRASAADGRQPSGEHPEALLNQLQAIVTILGRALRDLGFEEFEPAEGQPFDPHRMICAGYMEGPPGIVLKCTKPGFCAGDVVASPAMVLIADPHKPSSNIQPSGDLS